MSPFTKLALHLERAQRCVQLFYLMSAVLAYQYSYMLHQEALTAAALDYSWPVAWLDGRGLVFWIDMLSMGAFMTALGAAWRPTFWPFRAAFAVFTLMCGGFLASFGGINHLYHAWFWMAAALAVLPTIRGRADQLRYCLTFATAQGLLLAFYSLAGMWKAYAGLRSLTRGVEGNFSPRGLSLQLADRIVQTNTEPLLGRFFVDNYWLTWPMFLGMIYIQLVAALVVFRPSLHVAWGLALLAFHIGTWLLMEITFPLHFMMLLVFLVMSPFRPETPLSWGALRQLPIFGPLFRFSLPTRARLAAAR